MAVQIQEDWKNFLVNEFKEPYFLDIVAHLKTEKLQKKIIYPPGNLIFNAFNYTKPQDCKIVILGQDPYHNPNQAMGLSFSVPDGIKIPPSLRNIFKELKTDIGLQTSLNGNLTNWAQQGVFLLNASLTVRQNEPNSHAHLGWHTFTNAIIKNLSIHFNAIVFMLWGSFAQQKASLIDSNKHLILKSTHPSPFSAHNGFLGCKHFSKANEYLIKNGKEPIDWKI